MNNERIRNEAAEVFELVSKPRSITHTGTHVKKPNTSPNYKSGRIRATFEKNVRQDVKDAKAGIEYMRTETLRAKRKRP